MRYKSIVLATATLLALWPLAVVGQSQEEAPPHHHGAMASGEETAPMPMDGHPMMARHQEMREQMQAMDAELDGLLAEAEAATGDAKVEALTRVVAKLVEQRKAMHEMMQPHGAMPGMMMHHQMMRKDGGSGHCSMPDCPMMKKDRGGAEETPPDDQGSGPDDGSRAAHPSE